MNYRLCRDRHTKLAESNDHKVQKFLHWLWNWWTQSLHIFINFDIIFKFLQLVCHISHRCLNWGLENTIILICWEFLPIWYNLLELCHFHISVKKNGERYKDSQYDQQGATTANNSVEFPLVLVRKLHRDGEKVYPFDCFLKIPQTISHL